MKLPNREPEADVQLGRTRFRIRGVNRYDLTDPYHALVTMTWPQFLLSFLGLYLTVNVIFAFLYASGPHALVNARPGSLADAFFFSFETLATVGYGEMYPGTAYGHVVACVEIVCGLAFTAILTGLTFVRFSRPRARFVFAERLAVTTHNSKPTLMLRVGNGRPGILADARVRIAVLMTEVSEEGNQYRRTHELRLARNHIPVMPLAWTMMHELDAESPIASMDAAALRAADIRFFVAMEARDPSLGATVYDIRQYQPEELAFGMHYADAIETDADGTTVLNLNQISRMAEDATEPARRGGQA